MTVGRNLLNAASVLKSASKQIEELFGEFSNYLSGIKTSNGIGFRAANEADIEQFRVGWAQDAWRVTFLATDGGKRTRRGNEHGEVTLVVDLGREGWLAERVGEACLYVFWTGADDSWQATIDDGEFLPTEKSYVIVDENIFVWTDFEDEPPRSEADFRSDRVNNAWFFAVPLTAIDTRRKVHELLAQPIISLLEQEFDGLPVDHPALKFAWESGVPVQRQI